MENVRDTTHDRLATILRNEIRSGMKPGDRLPTILELRRRFKVSVNTVRTALLVLQTEGILELRQGSGCYVRTPPPVARHVAVLSDLNLLGQISSYFHRAVFCSLRQRLTSAGHPSRLYIGTTDSSLPQSPFSCRDFLDDLALDRIAGVAAVATLVHPEWVDPCRERGIPIVTIDRNPLLKAFASTVDMDEDAPIHEGVRILASQGCRRIALLAWAGTAHPSGPPGPAVNRFRLALTEAGLDYHPDWVRGDIPPAIPGAGWEEFRELWAARPERPDGLVVADDVLFDDARKAIQEMGIRVPNQLAIVSLANRGSNITYPFPLTLVELDPSEFARIMAEQLMQRLSGRVPENPHTVVTHHIREVVPSTPVLHAV